MRPGFSQGAASRAARSSGRLKTLWNRFAFPKHSGAAEGCGNRLAVP
jgi:hypothetical protein